MKELNLQMHLETLGQALTVGLIIGMGLAAISVALGFTIFGI